ncbi:hypothetical protein [Xenorhabdus sp. GDc328]
MKNNINILIEELNKNNLLVWAGQDHECFLVKNKQVASSKEL